MSRLNYLRLNPARYRISTHLSLKKSVITLLLAAYSLFAFNPCTLYSQDVRKLKLSNLRVSNNSGDIVNQITQGYGAKVRFYAVWDGFSMDRVKMQITIGDKLVIDELLEFRDRMGKFQTDFVKDIVIPKDIPDGKHQLTLKMLFQDPDVSNRTKRVLECQPVSLTIQIGKGGGQSAGEAGKQDKSSVISGSENSQTSEDDIIMLGQDVGSDNIQLHISTLNQKNWFGEVWLDEITASGGRTATRDYLFQQPALKDGGYSMYYKFVVLKGTVYFDRSYGRIGTSEDAVAYIDEYMEFDSPADRVHSRTLVLKANKFYDQTDLRIMVKNYFHQEMTIPRRGVMTSGEITTPTATASVRGTIYEVNVKADGTTTFHLYKGSLLVRNETGEVLLIPGSSVTIPSRNSPLRTQAFNTTEKFSSDWAGISPTLALKDIPRTSPLFVNVIAGGSLANPTGSSSRIRSGSGSGRHSGSANLSPAGIRYSENKPFKSYLAGKVSVDASGKTSGKASGKALSGDQNCLGKLKAQFLVPVSGSPSNREQQLRMKMAVEHNNMEQGWFREAEANFKKGILPKELTGTYRPDPNGKNGLGKYWSQTVTLFKEMTIDKVDGFATGFKLIQGDTDMEIHFSPVSQASGHVLKCGSYKIYVDPDERYEKVWVTVTLKE